MQRKLTYVSTACFCLFAVALFLTVELQSMIFGYIASALLLIGLLTSVFGLIFPILFFHVYHNVLNDKQKLAIRENPITRLMVYVGSNGNEDFR